MSAEAPPLTAAVTLSISLSLITVALRSFAAAAVEITARSAGTQDYSLHGSMPNPANAVCVGTYPAIATKIVSRQGLENKRFGVIKRSH